MRKKQKILFLCTHNSARSQMAEGLVRSLLSDRFEAYSAGVEPTGVHPLAIEVMKEIGIDISTYRSKSIEEFRGTLFDYVVTVCDHAQATCPFFPGKHLLHKGFPDPAATSGTEEQQRDAFRRTRDELKTWLMGTFSKICQK